jgi:hypothetical protein
MVVVGAVKKDILNAFAHKNLTTSVEDNEGWILRLISGVVMPCIGFVAIDAFTANSFSVASEPLIFRVLPKIVGGAFIAFGIYNLFCSVRVIQAINQLRKEVP